MKQSVCFCLKFWTLSRNSCQFVVISIGGRLRWRKSRLPPSSGAAEETAVSAERGSQQPFHFHQSLLPVTPTSDFCQTLQWNAHVSMVTKCRSTEADLQETKITESERPLQEYRSSTGTREKPRSMKHWSECPETPRATNTHPRERWRNGTKPSPNRTSRNTVSLRISSVWITPSLFLLFW